MKKFKKTPLKKRIISMALSLVMILGMLPLALTPIQAQADSSQTASSGNSYFDEIINASSVKPDGYDEHADFNPYGAMDTETPFMLTTYDELYFLQSSNGNVDANWVGTYNGGTGPANDTRNSFSKDKNLEFGANLAFVEAVACDPLGTGRDDHIAYVGYSYHYQRFECWFVNAATGRTSEYKVLCDASWIGGADDDVVPLYTRNNFTAIAAGRFDTSKKGDTVAIYVAGGAKKGNCSDGLYEVRMGSDYKISIITSNRANPLNECAGGSKPAKDPENHLSADLAAGDFDNDGIEDLAIISSRFRVDDPENYDYRAFTPRLVVQYGADGGNANVFSTSRWKAEYVHHYRDLDEYREIETIFEAGLAAGDVDGDGIDEIVMAGIHCDMKTQKNENRHKSDKNGLVVNRDNFYFCSYSADSKGNLTRDILKKHATTAWTEGTDNDGFSDKDEVAQQIEVETVAINGPNAKELVFTNGSLFEFSSNSNNVSCKHTPKYFNENDNYVIDTTTNLETVLCGRTFIQSVAVGNFDHNEAGREQVAFIIGYKDWGSEGHDYYAKFGMMGGKGYADDSKTGTYGAATGYFCTDIDSAPTCTKMWITRTTNA